MSCMAGPSGEGEEKSTTRHIIGYNSYSDAASSNLATHLHSFGPPPGPEMYNMDNIIAAAGFPPKTHHQVDQDAGPWKGFFTRPAGPSSSISPNKPTINNHHHHPFNYHHDLTELLDDDVDDPSSLRSSCVFTCEGLERPSHGLSLSLSSSNPSSIGLQSFELRQQQQQQQEDFIRFGPSSSRSVTNNNNNNIQQYIRQSRYLLPAQELLSEFCNLQNDDHHHQNTKMKGIHHDDQESEINAIKKQSLYSLDLIELQRRKNKLLHMLEEVDRRYKQYCTQMRGVAAGFEAVAGEGASAGYSALASRAMSRHFRCLKDGIMRQVKATKKAMGEKDTGGAPGTAKGETPRLRLLDQTLRQQRALQQMSNMEIHPWRPQRGLPERSVSVLRAWLFEHFLHPYPSDVDKHILARQTGLSRSQVSNWFINARVRLWKPMVEEMYLEELKEEQPIANEEEMSEGPHSNPREQKPTHEQLVRIDSECLSSIINHPADKNDVVGGGGKNKAIHVDHGFGDSFGAMEFDFSSYGDHHSGGAGVSLTLGLHQHGGGGGGGEAMNMNMNMPFSPAVAGQGSLFYHRDHNHNHHGIEDCQTVQYSLLDGEAQNLPYRNLMGAQLLHDLAG